MTSTKVTYHAPDGLDLSRLRGVTRLEPEFSNMVLQAQEDWLFLQNDSNKVVEQNQGKVVLTKGDLEGWRNVLELREAWLRSRGAHYIFSVAPNKESIYFQNLPADYNFSKIRPGTQLLEYVRNLEFLNVVDPTSALQTSACLTYHKTDTHWNDRGGWIAAGLLLAEARKLHNIPVSRAEPKYEDHAFLGDLGRKLLRPAVEEASFAPTSHFTSSARNLNSADNTGSFVLFTNPVRNLPVGVFFADSFGGMGSVAKYLAEYFSDLYVLWQPHFDFRLIERISPQIVISQICERFLVKIPDDIRSSKLSALDFSLKFQAK